MKARQVKRLLWRYGPPMPDAELDERVRMGLGVSASERASDGGIRRPHRRLRWMLAACTALTVGGIVLALSASRGGPDTLVWAQVERGLERNVAQAETIHLKWRVYHGASQRGVKYGEVVSFYEVWAARPGKLRRTQWSEIAPHLVGELYAQPRRMETLHNEKGEWNIDHTGKRWAMRSADTLVMGRTPARVGDNAKERVDTLVRREFRFPFGIAEDAEGRFIGAESDDLGTYRKYEFEGQEGDWTVCWFREDTGALSRVERGSSRAWESKPTIVYGPIELDAPIPPGTFEPPSLADYQNGQEIGLEEQPFVLTPSLVEMDRNRHSVAFRKRSSEIESDTGATSEPPRPDIHVYFEADTPGLLRLEGKAYSALKEDGSSAYVWGLTAGRDPLGSLYFGVARDRGSGSSLTKRMDMQSDLVYDGSRSPMIKVLTYATDRIYAKVAYDADGDGRYDAWARIAEHDLDD